MPQMSPMSWVIMMILFISMYMIFNTMNFFTLYHFPQSLEIKKKVQSKLWKW
uniref:ATP synthase F0 subunit 8 n=1 Tax=Odontolabis cuvera fallaciosa TaxID=619051 RepID=A0A3G1TVR0_9SCAR|nr:ATP synthase F0 subunit 8 [Odontolabis cuvera fallaciosa]